MWYYTSLTLEYVGRVILRQAQQDTLFVSLRLSKGKGNPTKLGAL